jgi:serine/threonine-protein phosphatase 6 regulatory subunit 3
MMTLLALMMYDFSLSDDNSFTHVSQDDTFGPFSDTAVASGADPFTFSPTFSRNFHDSDEDDSFGAEFGDFQSAAGEDNGDADRESTPTAESWSFTSGSSSGLTDSAEDLFGVQSIGASTAGSDVPKEETRTAEPH